MTLRAPLPLLEEGREGGTVLVGSGGCATTSACCHACKHFICIDFNGVAALNECSFKDFTTHSREK